MCITSSEVTAQKTHLQISISNASDGDSDEIYAVNQRPVFVGHIKHASNDIKHQDIIAFPFEVQCFKRFIATVEHGEAKKEKASLLRGLKLSSRWSLSLSSSLWCPEHMLQH